MSLIILRINIVVVLLSLAGLSSAIAQTVKVPLEVQVNVIPKILSLNKSFKLKNGESFNSTIVYSSNQRNSKRIYDGFKKLLGEKEILLNNHPTNFYSIEVNSLEKLREHIRTNNIKMIYITPLRGVNIKDITQLCKEESVLTITAVEEYENNNISVILSLEQSKLNIKINQKSAKGEGADFSSRLLKIAKLIN